MYEVVITVDNLDTVAGSDNLTSIQHKLINGLMKVLNKTNADFRGISVEIKPKKTGNGSVQ